MRAALLLLAAALPLAGQEEPTPERAPIEALIRQGRYDQALGRLSALLREQPADPALRLLAARCLYLRGAAKLKERGRLTAAVVEDMRMSLEQSARILERHPENRDARLVTAQAHYLAGRPDEAEKEVRRILESRPDDGGAHFLLATILFGRSGEAVRKAKVNEAARLRQVAAEHYRRALDGGTKRAETCRRLGDIAATDGDLEEALELYRRALSRDAAQAPHRWLLQNCRPDQAIPVYRKSAEARLAAGDRPGAAFLWMYIGFYREKARQWREARQAALRALELDPEGCWVCRYRAGWCSWWLEEREKAKKAFLTLMEERRRKFCDYLRAIGPEGRTAAAMMHALAAEAVKAGRRGEARDLSLLRAIIRGRGEDWNNYAFLCRETGRYEEAWVGYRRALEKEPGNPRYLNDGALILHYHLKRRLDHARKLYEQAVKEARRILADPEADPGTKAEARSALRDAQGNLRALGRRRSR